MQNLIYIWVPQVPKTQNPSISQAFLLSILFDVFNALHYINRERLCFVFPMALINMSSIVSPPENFLIDHPKYEWVRYQVVDTLYHAVHAKNKNANL